MWECRCSLLPFPIPSGSAFVIFPYRIAFQDFSLSFHLFSHPDKERFQPADVCFRAVLLEQFYIPKSKVEARVHIVYRLDIAHDAKLSNSLQDSKSDTLFDSFYNNENFLRYSFP